MCIYHNTYTVLYVHKHIIGVTWQLRAFSKYNWLGIWQAGLLLSQNTEHESSLEQEWMWLSNHSCQFQQVEPQTEPQRQVINTSFCCHCLQKLPTTRLNFSLNTVFLQSKMSHFCTPGFVPVSNTERHWRDQQKGWLTGPHPVIFCMFASLPYLSLWKKCLSL